MSYKDKMIESLLDLDGVRYVVNEHFGIWVKFEAKLVKPSHNRPHSVRYALTLHDRYNVRIMGFDNAHAVEYGEENTAYDHWHRNKNDRGKSYHYKNAGKLLEDFWREVDKVLYQLEVKDDEQIDA